MLSKMGFVATTCAFVLFSAAAPTYAQEHMRQAVPDDGERQRLTIEQLRDGRYHLPLLGDEETAIRLHGGRGSIKYGDGTTEQVHAGLVRDLVAFGDLDGDDVADAAAVFFIDSGGSGMFIHLIAMLDRNGVPVQAGREFIGDRVRVQSLTISDGRVVVTMLAHGPGDGLCCPSTEITRAFTLCENRLVPSRTALRRTAGCVSP